jgi:protein tyrosine phosphatase (PTP) superfamily phosphohydrolase (DUF442 family)
MPGFALESLTPQELTSGNVVPLEAGNAQSRAGTLSPAAGGSALPQASYRPAQWAQKVPGITVPNLYRVTPNLYRSAQFSRKDITQLHKLGIRKIISLRSLHDDTDLLAGSGIKLQRIPMKAWFITDEGMASALGAMRLASSNEPTLIHCQQGADRTGLAVALYRVAYQGWTKEQALDEMRHGDYGFHEIWQNIVEYFKHVDILRLRKLAEAKP